MLLENIILFSDEVLVKKAIDKACNHWIMLKIIITSDDAVQGLRPQKCDYLNPQRERRKCRECGLVNEAQSSQGLQGKRWPIIAKTDFRTTSSLHFGT